MNPEFTTELGNTLNLVRPTSSRFLLMAALQNCGCEVLRAFWVVLSIVASQIHGSCQPCDWKCLRERFVQEILSQTITNLIANERFLPSPSAVKPRKSTGSPVRCSAAICRSLGQLEIYELIYGSGQPYMK
jgi:hypothetical protein